MGHSGLELCMISRTFKRTETHLRLNFTLEFAFVLFYPFNWGMSDEIMISIGILVTFPEFNYESIDFTAFSLQVSDTNVVAFLLTTDMNWTLCLRRFIFYYLLKFYVPFESILVSSWALKMFSVGLLMNVWTILFLIGLNLLYIFNIHERRHFIRHRIRTLNKLRTFGIELKLQKLIN